MNYYIKIEEEIVFRTDNKQDAFKTISEIFQKGHMDVSLHGGRIGKWWND